MPAKSWNCAQCGTELPLGAEGDICPKCEKRFTLKRRVTREEAVIKAGLADKDEGALEWSARDVVLTTTDSVEGFRAVKTFEIVSAECVYGVNAWRELIAGFTDFFGGRSGQFQSVLRDLRQTCLKELRIEAAKLGANAVVAVRLSFNEIGSKGMSMLMLVASGTAVKIERTAGEKSDPADW